MNFELVTSVTHLEAKWIVALDTPAAGYQTARPWDGEFVPPERQDLPLHGR
jgi:hypothetical protein